MGSIIYAVVMLAIAAASYFLARPKVANQKPATLSDFDLPQVDEGTPQCVVFGDVWVNDWMVLSYGNLRVKAIKSKSGK